ncbi:thioesterase II family protein [Actinosynnema sp. NPDC059797]
MRDAVPWIRHYPSDTPPATPWTVLFFPHSGASSGSYRDLATHLSATAATACVHYPGRGDRTGEPSFQDVHHLADAVADAFAAAASGPVLFFGHSLGAAVAYEVALRTDHRDLSLVVSGHPAPHRLPETLPTPADEGETAALVASLNGSDARLLTHPVLRRLFLPVVHADLTAHSRYHPTPGPLDLPLTVLTGHADPLTPAGSTDWSTYTTAGYAHHTVPGGHFFTDTHPGAVVDILLSTMAATRHRSPRG